MMALPLLAVLTVASTWAFWIYRHERCTDCSGRHEAGTPYCPYEVL